MKLKDKIRTKLAQFLLLDDMQEHNLSEIERLESLIKLEKITREGTDRLLKENVEVTSILQNTIRNVVSVGADIYPYDRNRSWAVVCVEGNPNIVKFVDLSRQETRYVMDFLKQFEGSRMCVDAFPTRMFEDSFKLK